MRIPVYVVIKMMRTSLQTLFDDVQEVRLSSGGRYKVQLEIPKGSTLTEEEIKDILRISSWKVDPNSVADDYEGSRAIVRRRKQPIKKGPVELSSLEISGIGHAQIDFSGKVITSENKLSPPNTDNFMNNFTDGMMSTSYAEGNVIKVYTPTYRAFGAYTTPELREKVAKTQEIASIELKGMVVPHVEAYGRYLNPALQNSDGPFGFIVFPVPDPKVPRAWDDFVKRFTTKMYSGKTTMKEAFMTFFDCYAPNALVIGRALRDLHDTGRRAHLQIHMGNFYVTPEKPYVVDWATMRKLDGSAEQNILNRALDLMKPANVASRGVSQFIPDMPEFLKDELDKVMCEIAMESYSGHPQDEIRLSSIQDKFKGASKGMTPFDAIVLWLKDQGMEGYDKKELVHLLRKVGRNEPCPCGSGQKYKRCHGRVQPA